MVIMRTECRGRTVTRWLLLSAFTLLLVGCGGEGATTTNVGDQSTIAGDTSSYDADVTEAYETYVKDAMPNITLDVLQAAKDEGSLVYYLLTNSGNEASLAEFEKRFPFIAVEAVLLSGGPAAERFAAEKSQGLDEVDIFSTSLLSEAARFAEEEEWCEEYLPSADDRYPEAMKVPGYVYPLSGAINGIVVRPDAVNDEQIDALQSWEGLVDPAIEGLNIGWIEVTAGGSPLQVATYMYSELGGVPFWQQNLDLAGDTFIYNGTGTVTEAVEAGEIDLGIAAVHQPYSRWLEGAAVGWVTPTPLLMNAHGGCIASNPPHPNAARLAWEWILSEDAQAISTNWANGTFMSGFTPSASDELAAEPWYNPPEFSNTWSIEPEEQEAIKDEVVSNWIIGQ